MVHSYSCTHHFHVLHAFHFHYATDAGAGNWGGKILIKIVLGSLYSHLILNAAIISCLCFPHAAAVCPQEQLSGVVRLKTSCPKLQLWPPWPQPIHLCLQYIPLVRVLRRHVTSNRFQFGYTSYSRTQACNGSLRVNARSPGEEHSSVLVT